MIAPVSALPQYCGRFAPSPTGPLHFGSLVAALASWLDARHQGGRWLVRMEDLDTPRTVPGAADDILCALEACGLQWDGEVAYQSRRTALYQAAFDSLQRAGQVFACACSRREIADSMVLNAANPALTPGEAIYPGTCRAGLAPGRSARAWRARVDHERVVFEDAVQGSMSQDLALATGDFVVRRADGPVAYQLAVVVDDADQGVTHVVRGADLLDSTPRQIHLQRLLGLAQPAYAHVPAAINAAGEKLSKQTRARSLRREEASAAIHAALDFLGQQPPAELQAAPVTQLLEWACRHWAMGHVPARRSLTAPALFSD